MGPAERILALGNLQRAISYRQQFLLSSPPLPPPPSPLPLLPLFLRDLSEESPRNFQQFKVRRRILSDPSQRLEKETKCKERKKRRRRGEEETKKERK